LVEIVTASQLRSEIEGEWLLILSGLVSVLFGVVVLARPVQSVVALLWLIATFAVVFGVVLVFLAFKARGFARRVAAA